MIVKRIRKQNEKNQIPIIKRKIQSQQHARQVICRDMRSNKA